MLAIVCVHKVTSSKRCLCFGHFFGVFFCVLATVGVLVWNVALGMGHGGTIKLLVLCGGLLSSSSFGVAAQSEGCKCRANFCLNI